MSTLRINNIEAQSVPASPTIDEKVKVTNSSGDILVNIDGKTSGITTIGINTTDGNIKFDANSNVLITGILTATTLAGNFTPDSLEIGSNIKIGNAGVITATSFVGSGANLTNLPAQATIANNADNRVITGGSGVNLNGEANLTFSSRRLTSGGLTLNDDGVGGNIFQLYADDHNPWVFAVGNSTYHASSGLLGQQSNNGDFLLRMVGNSEFKSFTFEQYDGSTNRSWMDLGNGGNVVLHYQGSERFRTTADGIKLTPDASGILIESGGDTNWTTGAMNVVRMGSNQADIRLGSNYGVKIGISGNNDANEFQFQQSNTNDAFIRNEASNKIEFQTGGNTARFRIDNNGNCTINDGNLVIGTAGHGIDFSATSDATHTAVTSGAQPSTDSEVLSDYEHGTWTPRLRAYDHTGGAGWNTMKYTDGTEVTGTGRYVRIGNHVWAGFKFESGSKVFDSNWTYWSIDSTPYGANHYDKASGSLYVNQTNFFTDSNSHIGGFVHGNESYMVVNKPNGHSNATINSSNNNRYCYGHISIYTSRT